MAINPSEAQTYVSIQPATHMGPATLAVADLARSVDFYTNVLGMTVLNAGENGSTMGAGTTPLLHLQAKPGAKRQPEHSTGLYHVAILQSSRPDLGRVVINLARTQYQVGGFADHLVSEAIYLDDPDGNGLEIYRDRPREEWRRNGNQIVMASDPIDLDGIVASVEDPEAPFTGMPDGTTIGHMHLRVGDIPKAQAFYQDVLGFDVVAKMPSALFVSAGGYHHHIGMNVWHSRNAPPAPADSVGLQEYGIVVPDTDAQGEVLARLNAVGVTHEMQDADALFSDPWSNRIRLSPENS
ncbi:MAG: VOC family protein [Burkholderiales bacterium]|nr:VOC family protein [Anaerolineae bacterium]